MSDLDKYAEDDAALDALAARQPLQSSAAADPALSHLNSLAAALDGVEPPGDVGAAAAAVAGACRGVVAAAGSGGTLVLSLGKVAATIALGAAVVGGMVMVWPHGDGASGPAGPNITAALPVPTHSGQPPSTSSTAPPTASAPSANSADGDTDGPIVSAHGNSIGRLPGVEATLGRGDGVIRVVDSSVARESTRSRTSGLTRTEEPPSASSPPGRSPSTSRTSRPVRPQQSPPTPSKPVRAIVPPTGKPTNCGPKSEVNPVAATRLGCQWTAPPTPPTSTTTTRPTKPSSSSTTPRPIKPSSSSTTPRPIKPSSSSTTTRPTSSPTSPWRPCTAVGHRRAHQILWWTHPTCWCPPDLHRHAHR